MSLTIFQIENAKPQTKPYKLFDGKGLYIEVAPTGARWWRFKYRIAGKEKRISLGVYPDVGLKDARAKLDDVRRQLASNIDPSEQRKAKKAATVQTIENTFESIAREWFALNLPRWKSKYDDKTLRRLEINIFPWLGARPLREITAPDLLTVLRRIESRNAKDTAHRVLQDCGRIFRYAIATSRADRDPARDLAGALAPISVRHYASIVDPKRSRRTDAFDRGVHRFVRHQVRPSACSAGVRATRRATQGRVVGV